MSVRITKNRGCKLSIPHLLCGAYLATFGAQTVLSELESLGRSNVTRPASPATDLGRTVLFSLRNYTD